MSERLMGIGRQLTAAMGVGGTIGMLTAALLGIIVARWFWAHRARQRRAETLLALAKDRTLVGLTASDLIRSTNYHVRSDAYDAPGPWSNSRGSSKRHPVSRIVTDVLRNGSKHRVLLVLGEPGSGKTSALVSTWARHASGGRAIQNPMFLLSLGEPEALETIASIGLSERERSTLLLDGLELDPQATTQPATRLGELLDLSTGFRRIIITARSDLFEAVEGFPFETIDGTASLLASASTENAKGSADFAESSEGVDSGSDESVPDEDGLDDTDGDDDTSGSAAADAREAQTAQSTEGPVEGAGRNVAPMGRTASHGIRVVQLTALSPKQVQRYLRIRYPGYRLFRRRAAHRILGIVPERGLSPLVLSQLPALVSHGKPLAEVPDLYEAIVDGSIRREHGWIKKEALFEWSKRLALRAYRSMATGQGSVVSEIDVKTVTRDDLPYPKWRLGADSLISRAPDGGLQFVHAAFAEWLYTVALCSMTPEARRDWLCGDDVPWTPQMKATAVLRCAHPMAALAFADLRGANLSGMDLADSSLWKAHLEGANLSGANLRRADLRGAQLTGANLAGADLTEADLSGAELGGANLEGAILRGTALVSASINPAAAQSIAPPSAELDQGLLVEPLTGMRLAWIPGGRFQMGSPKELNESPPHLVRLSSFWMGQTPVTNRQYECFLKATGHERPACVHDPRFSDPDQPVVGVSHTDARAFCTWLSEASGLYVSLPTEAQWEYAARGTDGREYPWGSGRPDPSKACFAEDAFDGRPAKVGSFPPGTGPFGTLDQAGNVWEWCLDAWDENAYVKRVHRGTRDAVDPVVIADEAELRSVRGGSWFFPADDLRASFRGKTAASSRDDDLGFRVVVLTTLAEVRDDSIFVDPAIAQANGILARPPFVEAPPAAQLARQEE